MNLSELEPLGSSVGIELDDANTKWQVSWSSYLPKYNSIYLTDIAIGLNLTEAINISVPSGKKAILLAASVTNGEDIQLEIDGHLRIDQKGIVKSDGAAGLSLVGDKVDSNLNPTTSGYSGQRAESVRDIIFRDNLIIRIGAPKGAMTARLSLTYILVKG